MIKRSFWLLALLFVAMIAFAQSNKSKPMSFNIQKEVKPAILELVAGSVEFVEPSGNNAIDANEECKIRLSVKNTGIGDGYNCTAKIVAEGTTNGVKCSDKKLSVIKVGSTMMVELPIEASMNTIDGKVNFKISVDEPMGFGTDVVELAVDTRKFVSPMLKVVDYTVTGASGSVLAKKTPFDLQLLLQNVEQGVAENVDVNVSFPQGVYVLGGSEKQKFAQMAAGETKSLEYSLIVPQTYASTEIPVNISIKERHGKYAENRVVRLQLNQTLASSKIVIDSKAEELKDIQIASLTSEVDKNIPVTNIQNKNTFAVIIANEKYRNVADVPFAINDGNIFRDYCVKTLGIPNDQIHYRINATGNDIYSEVKWLRNIFNTDKYKNAQIIFYYTGHGVPDVMSSNTAYLLPIDGIATDVSTGYKLDELYAALGGLSARSVTVFLDACFSGTTRKDGKEMLVEAKGVAIKAKEGVPQGNMVVFSAAQGNETAYPNYEEHHGMFTYFLLKKLQETKGDVTLYELGEYIKQEVNAKGAVKNLPQTPCVTPSASIGGEWREWKLK